MVQIKDSVLHVFRFRRPRSSRIAPDHASPHGASPRFGMGRLSRNGGVTDVRAGFGSPDVNSGCQQLVNNLSRELYIVDFRSVFRLPKKVRFFREIRLTFRKVGHVSRNSGTIQSASSKTGEIRSRVKPAEASLRLLFAGCVVRAGQGVPTAPARGLRGNVNKFLKLQP